VLIGERNIDHHPAARGLYRFLLPFVYLLLGKERTPGERAMNDPRLGRSRATFLDNRKPCDCLASRFY